MIVPIVNLKGGVGKTTTAIALATAAVRDGRSSEVIDADPQGSAELWAHEAAESGNPLSFGVRGGSLKDVKAAAREIAGDSSIWTYIDCPPSGAIADEAIGLADFVIVPTTTGAADMAKTLQTAAVLAERDVPYAILVTRASARTRAYRETMDELESSDASYFDTTIPQRESLKRCFGNAFPSRLEGYEGVWCELKEAVDGD